MLGWKQIITMNVENIDQFFQLFQPCKQCKVYVKTLQLLLDVFSQPLEEESNRLVHLHLQTNNKNEGGKYFYTS